MARPTWWRTLLIASNLLIISLMSHTPPSVRGREKVVGYVRNWVDLASFSKSIDYAKITHINVAFENPVNDRGDLSFNQADGALIAKAHARDVKILVSIGGGVPDNSVLKARYFDLIADAKRAGFVARLSG
jgi:GH18 family chitinase